MPDQAFGCQVASQGEAVPDMAEVVPNTQQDFWRPPTLREDAMEASDPVAMLGLAESGLAEDGMSEMCAHCGSEFMIGARFCHACGVNRPAINASTNPAASVMGGLWASSWAQKMTWLQSAVAGIGWRKLSIPDWLHYLHFHEIKRWVGLPTASLVAFFTGLGCIAGVLGVSLFYKASNLAEFQAIQMWRIEWLLGATASFVAGILLKKPSDTKRD